MLQKKRFRGKRKRGIFMKKNDILRLTLSAMFLALCVLLPFLTGQIPEIGKKLSPMHIPVLLCGFICGWPYGLAVGFIAPLLRSAMFGVPPLMPTALAMAFELAAYGTACGLLYKLFPMKTPYVYMVLILSMLAGRAVWGIASYLIYTTSGSAFTLQMFWAGAFANAVPGIILHILLIPTLILALQRAKLIPL